VSSSADDRETLDQLRVADARWRAIIDAAVDGIIVIDSAGSIEAFNASAERMFGYVEDEVLGKNVSLLMPEPYRSQHDGYLHHHIQTGERRRPMTAATRKIGPPKAARPRSCVFT